MKKKKTEADRKFKIFFFRKMLNMCQFNWTYKVSSETKLILRLIKKEKQVKIFSKDYTDKKSCEFFNLFIILFLCFYIVCCY